MELNWTVLDDIDSKKKLQVRIHIELKFLVSLCKYL
jgi:hypothetical protein